MQLRHLTETHTLQFIMINGMIYLQKRHLSFSQYNEQSDKQSK